MRKLFGVILSVALVMPLILAALLTYSITNWAFDRELYIEVLSSDDVQSQLLSDDSLQKFTANNMGDIEGLDTAAFGALIRSLITPAYFKDQITSIVNQVFDYLEGNADVLQLEFDLTRLKDEFSGPDQDQLLRDLAEALPVCQEDQITNNHLTLCKPESIAEDVFVEQYLKPNLPVLLMAIPNKVSIAEPIDLRGEMQTMPAFFQQFMDLVNYKTAILLLSGLALIFWFLTALIAGKDGRERLKWLGWTLILPSLFVLLLGVISGTDLARNLIQLGLRSTNFQNLENIPFLTQDTIMLIESTFVSKFKLSLITAGGIASAIGLGFIAWGAATHPARKEV